MLSRILFLSLFGSMSSLSVAQDNSKETSNFDLSNSSDATSYAIGNNIGANLIQQGVLKGDIPIDFDAFKIGIIDGVANLPKMTDEQMTSVLKKYQDMLSESSQSPEEPQQQNPALSAPESNGGGNEGFCAGYLTASYAFLTFTPNPSENNLRIGREMLAISDELQKTFNSNGSEMYTFAMEKFNSALKAGSMNELAAVKYLATTACTDIQVTIPQ